MTRIEREIVIDRPVDEVFDFVADGRNEPRYNPHLLRAEQTSAGSIGRGTRFRGEGRMLGRPLEMTYEITTYERPWRLASSALSVWHLINAWPIMDIQGTETFAPIAGGTCMRWSWEVELRGVFKLMTPLIARELEQRLDKVFATLKRFLEASETPVSHA